MSKFSRLTAAGAIAAAVLFTGIATATASTSEAPSDAADIPPSVVEDFAYPNADKILTEKGITLKRGDGHIILADCGSESGLLEVWPRKKETICFRVTGNSGYLSLEIPSVYAIVGNDYATQVGMTTGSEEKTFDIEKNIWTAVGETADPQGRQFMLMEIRTTR